MVMKVKLNGVERNVFRSMKGMINNELIKQLGYVEDCETLDESELRKLECVLETLKKDTENCLIIVRSAKEFMGDKNGKDR